VLGLYNIDQQNATFLSM